MERSEPALAPEWLKGSNGGITVSGSSLHHSASSSQSDDLHSPLPTRTRSLISSGDHISPRSSGFSDRHSSSHFRRSSSSNGSFLRDKDPSLYSRPYSSFGRSHRDRDREKDLDKEWLLLGDHHDFSDPLGPLPNWMERDCLRRSRSMVSGKQAEAWPKKAGNDTNNGTHLGGSSSSIIAHMHKSSFERDFPSLGTEEKSAAPEVGRVASPVLPASSQSLPMSSSTIIGGDGWTSALAEVPVIFGGINPVQAPVAMTAPSSSTCVTPTTPTGLNMAETLAQGPSRTRAAPQSSAETQRLEELAIKQSRQLIPMTPSMPKTSASSLEKPKGKGSRASELNNMVKAGQPASSSQLVNNTLRGPTRSDITKLSQSNGSKLLILKGPDKNGLSSAPATAPKETSSPTNASKPGVVPPATLVPSLRSPNGIKAKMQSPALDRRPLAQAQNRNDFFNSLRKKVSSANNNSSSAVQDSSTLVSSTPSDEPEVQLAERTPVKEEKDADVVSSNSALHGPPTENGMSHATQNGHKSEASERFSGDGENLGPYDVVYPDEEEAAFLRSLGWDESAGEEEALTEEEIKAFYEEYMKRKPSAKLRRGLQQLSNLSLESHINSFGATTSSVCGSSKSEGLH